MALRGINEMYVTVGTDYVYYQLLQKHGYSADELRRWIPDPAHQPWWILQNLAGGDVPITEALLAKRATLGRRIADRARELGITPVFPGYWAPCPPISLHATQARMSFHKTSGSATRGPAG